MLWFVISLVLVVACIVGKSLVISVIRRMEDVIRVNQQKMLDAGGRVKVAHQKYIIAQKAEGLAAHKAAVLRHRLSDLEDQITQVELLEVRTALEKQREVGIILEQVVRRALNQVGIKDEAQVQKLMGAISTLIDLEKQGSSEELVAAIRDKLVQLKEGQPTAQQEQTPPSQGPSPPPGAPSQPPVPQEATPVVQI